MTAAVAEILSRAQALSVSERAEIASKLLESLDGPPDSDWEDAWSAELERRSAASEAERATWPTADAVFARLKNGLLDR